MMDGTAPAHRDLGRRAIEKVLEELVQEGILRVARINEKGQKVYVATELGRSPHLILDVTTRKQ